MGRIIVVSNRVADPKKAAQAGGVAVALNDVVTRHGGLWAGWDGHIVDNANTAALEQPDINDTLLTAPMTTAEYNGFYLGYANSVLWPVFHNRLDLAQFEAGYFKIYRDVNARFAALLKPLIQPGDIIWVHDYHFILLGHELRKLGVENPIGFFLHIPIPPSQSFLAIPEHRDLAIALAAYDLVGLQTSSDVGNLLEFLQRGVDARLLNDGRVRAFDRIIAIESFPIGIDPAYFADTKVRTAQKPSGADVRRIVGIDRLDYSKGLPQKFRAFGRFLELRPEYRSRVVLTQIAPPTRESVEAYADVRTELESLSGSINGQFGELNWVPIHYMHRSVARSRLPGIYRFSHVALVTPLRDGMNLVAKEYIAAQDMRDPGVLILSRFAGAAEDMKEAVIVNPYNVEEMAEAISTALEMSLDERRERCALLLERIKKRDVTAWANGFISSLKKHSVRASPADDDAPIRKIMEEMGRAARRKVRSQPQSSKDALAGVRRAGHIV